MSEGANSIRFDQEFRLAADEPTYRVTTIVEYPDGDETLDEFGMQLEIRQEVQKQILTRLLDNVNNNVRYRIDQQFSE